MTLYFQLRAMITYLNGDCKQVLKTLSAQSVHCCVTSPPYWGLRDYEIEGQFGQEPTPEAYVRNLVEVFAEVRHVLRDDGTLWLNLGDSYSNVGKWGGRTGGKHAKELHGGSGVGRIKRDCGSGLKPKDLVGIPWRVAFALQADGWYLRSDIIWHKPNVMPESVTDRPTKAHEYLFLLTKSERYFYDADAIKEPAICGHNGSSFTHGKSAHGKRRLGKKVRPSQVRGSFAGKTEAMSGEGRNAFRAVVDYRNKRTVWSVPTKPYSGAHFAVFPPDLIRPCVLAGCPAGGVVLDPFGGSGTTGMVAEHEGRDAILIELNPEYMKLARQRTLQPPLAA